MNDKQNLKNIHAYGCGLLIELSECGTAAKIGGKKPRYQEIKYDNNGEPFITHYGKKLLLINFLRVEK